MKEEETQKRKENHNNRSPTYVCHDVTTMGQSTGVRKNNHHGQKSNNRKNCEEVNQSGIEEGDCVNEYENIEEKNNEKIENFNTTDDTRCQYPKQEQDDRSHDCDDDSVNERVNFDEPVRNQFMANLDEKDTILKNKIYIFRNVKELRCVSVSQKL